MSNKKDIRKKQKRQSRPEAAETKEQEHLDESPFIMPSQRVRAPLFAPRYVYSSSKTPFKKNIHIYAVFQKHNQDIPVCFASSFDEACYAAKISIFKHHFPHFKLWCDLRHLSPTFDSPQYEEYVNSIFDSPDDVPPEDQYLIKELFYSPDDIASFLRMFAHCAPLDLPHDHPEEYENWILDNGLVFADPAASASASVSDSLFGSLLGPDEKALEHAETFSKISPDSFKRKYDIAMESCRAISAAQTAEVIKDILDERRELEKSRKRWLPQRKLPRRQILKNRYLLLSLRD